MASGHFEHWQQVLFLAIDTARYVIFLLKINRLYVIFNVNVLKCHYLSGKE